MWPPWQGEPFAELWLYSTINVRDSIQVTKGSVVGVGVGVGVGIRVVVGVGVGVLVCVGVGVGVISLQHISYTILVLNLKYTFFNSLQSEIIVIKFWSISNVKLSICGIVLSISSIAFIQSWALG